MHDQTIGNRIEAARKAAGLSQDALGARLRVASRTIWGWESGQWLPRAGQLADLADALDCSVDWILGRTAGPEDS